MKEKLKKFADEYIGDIDNLKNSIIAVAVCAVMISLIVAILYGMYKAVECRSELFLLISLAGLLIFVAIVSWMSHCYGNNIFKHVLWDVFVTLILVVSLWLLVSGIFKFSSINEAINKGWYRLSIGLVGSIISIGYIVRNM